MDLVQNAININARGNLMVSIRKVICNQQFHRICMITIPIIFAFILFEITDTYINAENGVRFILFNFSTYLITLFILLELTRRKEKTQENLLYPGMGMIIFGVFSATFCAMTLHKIPKEASPDQEQLIIFGNMLQNAYLYFSAAIGGSIAAGSIYAENEKSLTKNKNNANQST
ncbi:hypothetical protein ACPRNU_23995 [Chromobacterium vaccinii]|uniref:hypothetical protein n=1 Tax=Chromobacterium vaccinii TaxID=1108595 RepID=UPI003C720DA0